MKIIHSPKWEPNPLSHLQSDAVPLCHIHKYNIILFQEDDDDQTDQEVNSNVLNILNCDDKINDKNGNVYL